MAILGYIPDSAYVETVWINEVPHLYPRVEFDRSPMAQDELISYWKAAAAYDGMALRTFVASILVGKIKRWDLHDAEGGILPITVATMLKLKNPLFNRLFAVVSMQEAPDGHRSTSDGDAEAEAQDLLTAMQSGRPLADVQEERRRKNCSSGCTSI